MSSKKINSEQGHWLLAKMGKRVLRPGGKELTQKLVNGLNISSEDILVEFAPGMGFTASLLLEKKPKNYIGIELNDEAARLLQKKISSKDHQIRMASAADTGLKDASVTKVIGEAMLTMQPDHRKSEIIREAFRILKPGGCYGIHELGLVPEHIDPEIKKDMLQNLSKAAKVNSRPLTKKEWCAVLEKEGFKIKSVEEQEMSLLRLKRVIADEGFFRTLKIAFNILTHPATKRKIWGMKNVFSRYQSHLTAFAIVAEK